MSVLPSVCDIILKLYWFQQVKITAFKYDNIRQGMKMGNYNFLFHNSEKKHLNCEIKNSELKNYWCKIQKNLEAFWFVGLPL